MEPLEHEGSAKSTATPASKGEERSLQFWTALRFGRIEEDEEAEAEDEVKARRRSDGAGDLLAVNPAMAIRLPLERVVMTMECWWNGKVG